MKKIFMLMGICALFLSVTAAVADDPRPEVKAGNLTVAVDGFKNDHGFAKMALANSSESYKDDAKSFMSKNVQIVSGKAVYSLSTRLRSITMKTATINSTRVYWGLHWNYTVFPIMFAVSLAGLTIKKQLLSSTNPR